MKLYLRHAALGAAALVIGTTAAQAQTVIERQVVDPPLVISPPQTIITREAVPAGTVITTPAPVTETIVTQPRTVERTIVTEPAPTRRIVTTHKTTTHAKRTAVRLSADQRRTVYRTIVHERAPTPVVHERVVTTGAAVAEPTAVTYRVGTVLPPSVPIYTMPQDVALDVPDVGPYDYALVNDRVLLVDPDTNTVVGEAYE
ncbi:MAG: DUF1236 domain-containing protein [Pseudolabrys sp.]